MGTYVGISLDPVARPARQATCSAKTGRSVDLTTIAWICRFRLEMTHCIFAATITVFSGLLPLTLLGQRPAQTQSGFEAQGAVVWNIVFGDKYVSYVENPTREDDVSLNGFVATNSASICAGAGYRFGLGRSRSHVVAGVGWFVRKRRYELNQDSLAEYISTGRNEFSEQILRLQEFEVPLMYGYSLGRWKVRAGTKLRLIVVSSLNGTRIDGTKENVFRQADVSNGLGWSPTLNILFRVAERERHALNAYMGLDRRGWKQNERVWYDFYGGLVLAF